MTTRNAFTHLALAATLAATTGLAVAQQDRRGDDHRNDQPNGNQQNDYQRQSDQHQNDQRNHDDHNTNQRNNDQRNNDQRNGDQRNYDQHNYGQRDEHRQGNYQQQNRPDFHFQSEDRGRFAQHYQSDANRWRNNRNRPQFRAGMAIPRNYAIRAVPSTYYRGAAPLPPGYRYGYYDGYVVSYDPTSRIIADVLDLVTGN